MNKYTYKLFCHDRKSFSLICPAPSSQLTHYNSYEQALVEGTLDYRSRNIMSISIFIDQIVVDSNSAIADDHIVQMNDQKIDLFAQIIISAKIECEKYYSRQTEPADDDKCSVCLANSVNNNCSKQIEKIIHNLNVKNVHNILRGRLSKLEFVVDKEIGYMLTENFLHNWINSTAAAHVLRIHLRYLETHYPHCNFINQCDNINNCSSCAANPFQEINLNTHNQNNFDSISEKHSLLYLRLIYKDINIQHN